MKFITEEDLRDLYRKQPFTNYDLQEGERLTPGARQFLVDRGIDMYDIGEPKAGRNVESSGRTGSGGGCGRNVRKLRCRLGSLRALFLLTAKDLLKDDVCASQQLMHLYRQLEGLKNAPEGICEAGDMKCEACSSINEENFSQSLGECFEITEFHMQMDNGRVILLLDRLRSETEILAIEAEELTGSESGRQLEAKLNQIINILSQMICKAMGGKECQRKG